MSLSLPLLAPPPFVSLSPSIATAPQRWSHAPDGGITRASAEVPQEHPVNSKDLLSRFTHSLKDKELKIKEDHSARHMWLTSHQSEFGTAEIRFVMVMGSGRVWLI